MDPDQPYARKWPSLFVLTSVYVVGELSHFLLSIVTRPMSQELQYGDKGCLANTEYKTTSSSTSFDCYQANNSESCDAMGAIDGINVSDACIWDYSGLGLAYQILAGPSFIAVFTVSGIFIAMVSDRTNRKIVVSICLAVLTTATTLTGAATSYWQLVAVRMAIGAGESSFSPACSSMICDMFPQTQRGLALGVFNWGIYFGYGLSYAIGNFVTKANIAGMGWRASYYVAGAIGVFVSLLLLFIVKEPPRSGSIPESQKEVDELGISSIKSDDVNIVEHPQGKHIPYGDVKCVDDYGSRSSLWENLVTGESGLLQVFKCLFKPSIIMLTIAASVRHIAGFTWAYNTQLYFSTYYPSYNLGIWITAISIIGGTLGVATGGFVSDKLVKKIGVKARLYVLAGSQLMATPFAVGVLYFSPPAAFYCLLGSYLFAEMWFGVLFAVLLELVPPGVQSTFIATFLFIMNNVGGNGPILIEPLRKALSYRTALLIMYPGNYLLSSVLFLISSFFV